MIAMGDQHTLALNTDGKVYSWGGYEFGQLGQGKKKAPAIEAALIDFKTNPTPIITFVACGPFSSSAITSEGKVFTWGNIGSGRLGLGYIHRGEQPVPALVDTLKGIIIFIIFHLLFTDVKIVSVGMGARHTIFLSDKGLFYGTGSNKYGQLGYDLKDFSKMASVEGGDGGGDDEDSGEEPCSLVPLLHPSLRDIKYFFIYFFFKIFVER